MHPVKGKMAAIASNPLILADSFISASFIGTKCCVELTPTYFLLRQMKLQRPFQNLQDSGGGTAKVSAKLNPSVFD